MNSLNLKLFLWIFVFLTFLFAQTIYVSENQGNELDLINISLPTEGVTTFPVTITNVTTNGEILSYNASLGNITSYSPPLGRVLISEVKRTVEINYSVEIVPNVLNVRFIRGATQTIRDQILSDITILQAEYYKEINLYIYEYESELTIEEIIEDVNAFSEVLYAIPSYDNLFSENDCDTECIPPSPYAADGCDFDPLFCDQWDLHHYAGETGSETLDIDCPEAWEITQGNAQTVIGINDSGVDYNHPDLIDNIWINPGEDANGNGQFENFSISTGGDVGNFTDEGCPGICGVDDDGDGMIDEDRNNCGMDGIDGNGESCEWDLDYVDDDDENGYIDDIAGWDFASDDNDPSPAEWAPGVFSSHGTKVAGVVAARGFNGSGISGVCPYCKIVPLKASKDYWSSSNVWKGIIYSANMNISIISSSLGGMTPLEPLEDALEYFELMNVLYIVAAGNRNVNIDDGNGSWPSNYNLDNIVSVTAVKYYGTQYGCYGPISVDIGAPTIVPTTSLNAGYDSFNGTSAAQPHVAGSAGLIHSLNPNLHYSEIKSILMDNITPLSVLENITVSGGLLNAYNSIQDVGVWISLSGQTSGNLTQDQNITIDLLFDLSGLVAGIYQSELIIQCSDPINPNIVIPIVIYSGYGCTDPNASNYDPDAIFDNGSCDYDITLSQGWNWISENDSNENMSVNNYLNSIGSNGIIIKNQTEFSIYVDEEIGWWGLLSEIENNTMYQIKMTTDDIIEFTGDPVDPSTPIPLSAGWQWVGYLSQVPMEINEALASLEPVLSTNDFIRNRIHSAYYDEAIGWFGFLTQLQPHEGYKIQMANAGTLIYPEEPQQIVERVVYGDPRGDVPLTPETETWSFNNHYYEFSGTITAQVYLNGILSVSDDDLLEVEFEGDIVGVTNSKYYPVAGQNVFMLTLFGNQANGDLYTFKYYDAETDTVYTLDEEIEFTSNMVTGTPLNPLVLHWYHRGCTDQTALNYNPEAVLDDNSCVYILGDVDDDGSITVIDLTLIVDIILEEITPTEYQLFAGDFKQDGTINILDVVEMVNYLLDRVDYYIPPGTVIVTKVIKQVGSPPFVMDVWMNNTTTVTGLQLEIILDPGYKALSVGNGTYSSNMAQAYKFNGDSTEVKMVYYGPTGEEMLPGNGLIANIGMKYVGTARGAHDPASGSIIGLIASNGGDEPLDSEVIEYEEFIRDVVGSEDQLLPTKYALHPAFPNPFNPITTISFDLPKDSNIVLKIYDINGSEVEELINSHITAGYQSIKWDATNYSSGVYIVRFEGGGIVESQKIVLLK